jgi:SAM-dependent methyltransferase
MVVFTCNVCGAPNQVEHFASEAASCTCGSNVRIRALIHLLSVELFGRSMSLADFPKLRSIRGLGISDKPCYGERLAEKFDYVNTFMDRDPRFDICAEHPELAGAYDFVLAADVLEHVAPPVETAMRGIAALLKPHGFLAATVPCAPDGPSRERFPDLHEYRVVPLGDSAVLVNRRKDGTLEVAGDLVFHGDFGDTLEMRQFSAPELKARLLGAGFERVRYFSENIPDLGILFDRDVSQPLVAARQPFVMGGAARSELVQRWQETADELWRERNRTLAAEGQAREAIEQARLAEARCDLAAQSRWFKLGRLLGIGPKLG